MSELLRIGHRGAKGYAPENTLKSIQKALDLNCDMIEMDVFTCRTGELMVFHDKKLGRKTNGTGYINKKSFDELRQLDAGEGEVIPTLVEALDLIDRKAKVNIELKGKKTLKPTVRIINRYVREKKWKYEDFIVSSFMRGKIKKIAKRYPYIPVGALLAYRPYGFLKFAQRINAYSVHIHKSLTNKDIVDEAHERNLKVFTWTVNEQEDIEYFKKMGVDGIFSDFPDRIKL